MNPVNWHNDKPYDENGEAMEVYSVVKRPHDIIRVFNPSDNKRNHKHIKLRSARKQKRVYDSLTLPEKGLLFSILPYLEWETNIIVGDGVTVGEKNRPLTWADIERINRISRPTRIKITESLIEKKVIGFIEVRGKRAAIVLNPNYALRGVKPDDALKQVFEYEVDLDLEDE